MNKVFLISGNAGQGKTTVAVNLAHSLRQFGFEVLLVDGDMHTPKLSYHLGLPLADRCIQEVLLGLRTLAGALYKTPSGIKLLFSSPSNSKMSHPSSLISQFKECADIIIIDVPLKDLNFYQGHESVLVSFPDFPSILEIKKASRFANVKGIILNRVHGDDFDLSPDNVSALLSKEILGVIPEEHKMREALKHGYSLIELYPDLKSSIAFKQTSAKLMNLEYYQPKRAINILAKLGFQ